MRLNKQSEGGPIGKVPRPDRESLLLLVHPQNDFCPGGALPVPGGDEIIPLINKYIQHFVSQGSSLVATRDWHPANHCSFVEQGGPWPPHCIQGSRGAQFHPDLRLPPGMMIVSGATNPKQEAYSGFDGTSLEERLEDLGVNTLYVVGLATDYCVKQTVLDACKLGFRVVILEDAVRGINIKPGDSQTAISETVAVGSMRAKAPDIGL